MCMVESECVCMSSSAQISITLADGDEETFSVVDEQVCRTGCFVSVSNWMQVASVAMGCSSVEYTTTVKNGGDIAGKEIIRRLLSRSVTISASGNNVLSISVVS